MAAYIELDHVEPGFDPYNHAPTIRATLPAIDALCRQLHLRPLGDFAAVSPAQMKPAQTMPAHLTPAQVSPPHARPAQASLLHTTPAQMTSLTPASGDGAEPRGWFRPEDGLAVLDALMGLLRPAAVDAPLALDEATRHDLVSELREFHTVLTHAAWTHAAWRLRGTDAAVDGAVHVVAPSATRSTSTQPAGCRVESRVET